MKNIVILIYSCLVLVAGKAVADDCDTYYEGVYTKNVASVSTEKSCAEKKASALVAESMKDNHDESMNQNETKKALSGLAVKEFKEEVDLLSRAAKGEDVTVELCQHIAGKKHRVQEAKFQLINKSQTPIDMFLESKLEEIISMNRLTDHDSKPISCASVDRAETLAFSEGAAGVGAKSLAYRGPSAVLLNARNTSVRWLSIIEGLKEAGAFDKASDVQDINAAYNQLQNALAKAKQKGLLVPSDTSKL